MKYFIVFSIVAFAYVILMSAMKQSGEADERAEEMYNNMKEKSDVH